MRFLFVIQPSNWLIGCHRIANQYRLMLESLGHETSLLVLPIEHRDDPDSPDWHYYNRVRIAKKTYDHIVVLEGCPPSEWLDSCASLTWIPMVEFTSRPHIETLDSRVQMIWHSKEGYDVTRRLRPDIECVYYRFGMWPRPEFSYEPHTGPLRVILHNRTRAVNTTFLAKLLDDAKANVEVVFWDNSRTANVTWKVQEFYNGPMSQADWFKIAKSSDVYVSTRAHEGIGLCVLEAAACGNIIIGPMETTVGEHFPAPNSGSILIRMQHSPQKLFLTQRYDWYSCVADSSRAVPEHIIKLSDNRDLIEHKRLEAFRHQESLFAEWTESTKEFFSKKEPRKITYRSQMHRRILHIQTHRGGDQGLIELSALERMSSQSQFSVFSTCLHTRNADSAEMMGVGRLLQNSKAINVAPSYNDLETIGADAVILHWSGKAKDWMDEKEWADVKRWLNDHQDIPLIVYVHEICPERWDEDILPSFVVYPSEYARSFYQEVHRDFSQFVVPYFVHQDLLLKQHGEKDISGFRLGFVGNMEWEKIDSLYSSVMFDIVRDRSAMNIMWVGKGDDSEWMKHAFRQKAFERFHYRGEFGLDRIKAIDSFHIGICISSKREVYPYSIIEMVSRGIPVITNQSDFADLVGDAGIIVRSPRDFREAIEYLIKHPSRLAELASNCEKQKDVYWTYEAWEERILDMIGHGVGYNSQTPCSVVIRSSGDYEKDRRAIVSAKDAGATEVVLVICVGEVFQKIACRFFRDVESGQLKIVEVDSESVSEWLVCGSSSCRGDIIVFMRGSDVLHKGAISALRLKFAMNTEISAVYCQGEPLSEDTKLSIKVAHPMNPGESLLDSFSEGREVLGSLIAVKRSALQTIGIDDQLGYYEIYDLMLRIEEIGRIGWLDTILYRQEYNPIGLLSLDNRDMCLALRTQIIENAKSRRSTVVPFRR